MIAYAIVLMTLNVMIMVRAFLDNDKDNFIGTLTSMMVYLPIFGRVLGWW